MRTDIVGVERIGRDASGMLGGGWRKRRTRARARTRTRTRTRARVRTMASVPATTRSGRGNERLLPGDTTPTLQLAVTEVSSGTQQLQTLPYPSQDS